MYISFKHHLPIHNLQFEFYLSFIHIQSDDFHTHMRTHAHTYMYRESERLGSFYKDWESNLSIQKPCLDIHTEDPSH